MLRPVPNEDEGGRRSGAGRVPPHNLEAEESLLGCMLLSSNAIESAAEQALSGEDFYKPAHGHIFDAIVALYAKGEPSAPVTVADELSRAGLLERAGGTETIAALQLNSPAVGAARRYCKIVQDHALLRRFIGVGGEIAEIGYSVPEDVDEAVDRIEALVFELRRRESVAGAVSLGAATGPWLEALELKAEAGGVPERPTGFTDLDALTGGLHPGRMMLVAGRPGMGKTSWGVALSANVADRNVPVLLVSVEMARMEVVTRFIAQRSQVDVSRLDQGKVYERDWPHIHEAQSWADRVPVEIVDSATATLLTVRAQARRAISKHGTLGLILVDYVQLMKHASKTENRQAEVAELARGLRGLGQELEVPIVALAQLNRGVENRADKRPSLIDLRESGELENSADVVVMLYRDEHYNKDSVDRGVAELIVEKNRQGPKGVVRLAANLTTGRWSNLSARGGV